MPLLDLTHKILMRRFLQEGDEYNVLYFRGDDILVIKRKHKYYEPWYTVYVARNFLGIKYWSFFGWHVGEHNYEKTS